MRVKSRFRTTALIVTGSAILAAVSHFLYSGGRKPDPPVAASDDAPNDRRSARHSAITPSAGSPSKNGKSRSSHATVRAPASGTATSNPRQNRSGRIARPVTLDTALKAPQPSSANAALRTETPRFSNGESTYVALDDVQALDADSAADADLARALGERFGVVFVQNEAHPSDLPKAAYNPRTGNLGVVTGVFRIRWKGEPATDELRSTFGFDLVQEFPHLRFTLLRSHSGERIYEDLSAIRLRADVESAELEVLETPASPM